MKRPNVSVVIPAYNHERYVSEAIRSVLDQTFRDFELIIINDGSTDGTETEILKFKDDRIRYYSQSNRGLSATLNRGIDLARGEYFSFLPSDDLFFPEKIETQLEEFQTGSPDLGMVFSRQMVVDANGYEITEDPIIEWFDVPYRTKEEIFPALFEKNFLPAPTFMGRKACFEKVGSFDESLRYCQDYDIWLRMLRVYDIRIVDRALLRYRWHGQNLTYAKTERADFERAVLLLKAIKIIDFTDIFPSLKGLEKREAPERYATSYRVLAGHLLKSGLIELVPVAYGLMEEAWKLEPSLELEKEMEDLVQRRPHFLDLRDERLGQLSQQVADLNHRLNRLHQLQSVLERQREVMEQQEKEWEKKRQRLDQQEKEMIEKT
ncbi:MAG TPA: glycosyltransferase, partial [Thermodesulfobacteriota bacterium]|nr:glycosyltransferase [Thermodesulfobacteriota bacterium]